MKVSDIATLIERIAPLQLQESYDNAGLQVGDPEQEVSCIITTLDVTEQTIALAIKYGANLIVSHHPLLFRGTKQINPRKDYISRILIEAIRHDIAIYSAHTNLDNAPCGVNQKIGEVLTLQSIQPLALLSSSQMEGISEEMIERCGSGIIGELKESMQPEAFIQFVKEQFKIEACLTNAEAVDLSHPIKKVALCGGAGDEFISVAARRGADVYLTGEVSYHNFFGHQEILILSGGHFETEQYTSKLLQDIIQDKYPLVTVYQAPKSSPIKIY